MEGLSSDWSDSEAPPLLSSRTNHLLPYGPAAAVHEEGEDLVYYYLILGDKNILTWERPRVQSWLACALTGTQRAGMKALGWKQMLRGNKMGWVGRGGRRNIPATDGE